MRRAGEGFAVLAEFGEHPGLEERLHQRQHALVLDPRPHPVHHGGVRHVVEGRLDVRVQHPAVAAGAVVVDLGDRVLGPPPGPEPVGDGLEVRLEDRLQHQLQRGLDDPVRDGRYAQPPQLPRPARLGNHPLPHRQRPERAVLEGGPQVVQEPGHSHHLLDVVGGQAVHARSVRALVARDPGERHDQRRRVVHEVEQVIKPAARISRRPTVKLGLHPRYPVPTPRDSLGAAIRRRVLRHCSLLPFSKPLPPFAM